MDLLRDNDEVRDSRQQRCTSHEAELQPRRIHWYIARGRTTRRDIRSAPNKVRCEQCSREEDGGCNQRAGRETRKPTQHVSGGTASTVLLHLVNLFLVLQLYPILLTFVPHPNRKPTPNVAAAEAHECGGAG